MNSSAPDTGPEGALGDRPGGKASAAQHLQQKLAEQEQAIAALRLENARLQSFAAISADWHWEQDAQHRFTSFTAGDGHAPQAAGDPVVVIGKCRWDCPDAAPLGISWTEHRAVLDTQQAFHNFEYVQNLPGCEPLYLSVKGVPLFDAKGVFCGYRGTTRNISSRKILEQKQGESTRFLNGVVENIPISIHMLSVAEGFRIVGWNRKAQQLFGASRQEMMGRTVHDLWPQADADRMHASDLELVAANVTHDYPNRLHRTRDGRAIRIHMRKVPLTNSLGVVTHILMTTEDVTERLEAETRLRQGEARHRAVISALAEAVVLRDAQGLIVDCNASAERVFGKTLDKVRGLTFIAAEWQILREDGSLMPFEEHPNAVARRTGLPQSNRLVCYRKPDGSDLWCLINVQPLLDGETGKPTGFVTSLTDVTKRKRAELEVVRLNVDLENRVSRRTAQLQAANRELEAFSYSVAHDLRSPLGSMDGFCTLLQKALPADANQRAHHYMERIRLAVRRMGELTNGLLALAQLSRTSLQWQAVDLSAEAARVLQDCAESEPGRQAQVSVEAGLVVRGDSALLRQLLENLIANAWKFTSKKARTEITIASHAAPEGHQVFLVRDNGAGFDMAYANKLFGTFQRLHSVEEFPGTGIGLATVDRIVRRHGGKIWADSVPGEGSTFFFTLGREPEQDRGPATAHGELPAGAASPISTDNDAFVLEGGLQFSSAFEHSPIGMSLIGLDSHRLRVNGAFCRMLGYTEAEMMAPPMVDVTHPEDIEFDLAQRQRAIAGEIESFHREKRYIHRSGAVVWAYLTCSLVRDADRAPLHFISQVQDITARKQTEQNLIASEERFRALTKLSSDWFWEQDENFRFTSISGRADPTGVSVNNTIGKTRWDVDHITADPGIWTAHRAQLERHEAFRELELPMVAHDGTIRYMVISGVPVFDAAGKFTGYRGTARDTTAMRRATDALSSSEALLRQITNTVPALMAYIDSDQRFRFHNRAVEEALGLTHAQITGNTMRSVMGEDFYERSREQVLHVLDGYPVTYERHHKTARRGYRDYVVSYLPRYGEGSEQGLVIGFYAMSTDITELKRMDRLNSGLSATMSRQFQAPLLAIEEVLGHIALGMETAGSTHALAAGAQHDCRQLLALVTGMLEPGQPDRSNLSG